MRIAIVERFREPSRNCDPGTVGGPGDDIEVMRLGARKPHPHSSTPVDQSMVRDSLRVHLPWRCIVSLWKIITDADLSAAGKRRLIASALATGGAPLSA